MPIYKQHKRGKGHAKRRSFTGGIKSHHHSQSKSTAVLVEDAAKYFDCTLVEETVETHLVPRQSLSAKQFLSVRQPVVETEAIPGKQLLPDGRTIKVNDQRVTWKLDKTLLRRGKPFQLKEGEYKREGKIIEGQNSRKYREVVPNEGPQPIEEPDNSLSVEVDPDIFK